MCSATGRTISGRPSPLAAASGKPGGVPWPSTGRSCWAAGHVKLRATGSTPLESVNARYAATVTSLGLRVDKASCLTPGGKDFIPTSAPTLFLLKPTPGLSPNILMRWWTWATGASSWKAFGLGGVNILHRGWTASGKAVDAGISVVVTAVPL